MSGTLRFFSKINFGGFRTFGRIPDPDPEINPKPSQKVIDIVDAIEDLTVKEVVWLCKLQQERFNISDAELGIYPMYPPGGMPVAAAPAEAPSPAPEKVASTQVEFDVIVEGYDAASKIKIIKEVEKLPATIQTKLKKEDAEQLENKLKNVGAKVVIK